MGKKALVLDIDGTLTNSAKEITPLTKSEIQRIAREGHAVVLASGRPTPGMKRYEKELELAEIDGYLLSFNGARIVSCKTGEVVYQKILPSKVPGELYEVAKKYNAGLISYEGDMVISAFTPDKYVEWEAKINGLPIKTVDNFKEYITFDVNKCLMTAEPEVAEVIEKELAAKYEGQLSVYRSEPFFIEIMPQNVDKATSLDGMIDRIGVKREDTICCGDGFNDISMIQYAGVGVAMANAQEKVKEAADYITGSNDEDGLVEVIRKFISE